MPHDDPITVERYKGESVLLGTVGMIALLQSGIGLLELDFCTSKAMSRRMRRSMWYEFLHYTFRLCEVTSRVSLFIAFMVLARQLTKWWWVPLAGEFLITTLLVAFMVVLKDIGSYVYSAVSLARLPTSFFSSTRHTNVALALLFIWSDTYFPIVKDEIQEWWKDHLFTNTLSVASIPLYWVLLWWIQSREGDMVDIFTACANGSQNDVRKAMRDLTKSAAVGLNINCTDTEGYTPMMFAASRGHDNVCRLLLREGAKIEARVFRKSDSFSVRSCFYRSVGRQWTALHLAAQHGHVEVVRTFLEALSGEQNNRGNFDAESFVDNIGETPLHVAAWSGHVEVAQLLAARQPQWITFRNRSSKTAMDLARTEEMQRAIAAPSERSVPLTAQAPPSPTSATRDQAWPQIELEILRIGDNLSAPGLCSYIASSCGGALGKVFLATDQSAGPAISGALPSISEADEDDSSFQLGSTDDGRSGFSNPAHIPAMEDLEPINADGRVVTPPCLRSRASTTFASENRACNCCRRKQRVSLAIDEQIQAERFKYIPDDAILGEGAYGMVWRAKDNVSGKWYAVKNIRTRKRGDGAIATRECEVANCIKLCPHPCLVSLYHVRHFAESYLYCLVMEFCPAGDLLDTIKEAKKNAFRDQRPYTPPRLAHHWIGQIFLGLEHMHLRMDTLLRDLKPDNCVLTSTGQVKLTDFGFGRFGVEACGDWSFGIPTGSPGYVAPEILTKDRYDFKVDLYSFGVLTWVLLTGGLTTYETPRPPLGGPPQDFKSHINDWFLLQQCLVYPTQFDALQLDPHPCCLVQHLTYQLPESRWNHRQIRSHAFMQQLQLPSFHEAPRK
eukprot:CAMPEP_0169156982 /NCGR_PEP_ID=MMETSP1015-20121227/54332_1 /TAXON_ID=342587 /ORGANISM="Karlodinium micrum, Strain CCMP2283" /LENGTH=841 /DNA_ID=CAMNT_0009227869 /DNA_START=518 /DNA_END=3041 /DNA_ORIENTATION=+